MKIINFGENVEGKQLFDCVAKILDHRIYF